MIVHMSLDIRGALLNWPMKKFERLLRSKETGQLLSAREAKWELIEMLGDGQWVMPLGECPKFNLKKGCECYK